MVVYYGSTLCCVCWPIINTILAAHKIEIIYGIVMK